MIMSDLSVTLIDKLVKTANILQIITNRKQICTENVSLM